MEELKKKLNKLAIEAGNPTADVKLFYFGARGRGEISRLILHYAGVNFADVRMDFPQFGELKPHLPYNQVPALEFKGTIICQSMTIARFLAAEYNIEGKTNLERAQASEIVDAWTDLGVEAFKFLFNPDKVQQATMKAEYVSTKVPIALGQLESKLKERGGQFFAGNNITWADLMTLVLFDNLRALCPSQTLAAAPLLSDLARRVADLPNIKSYLSTRPIDPMLGN